MELKENEDMSVLRPYLKAFDGNLQSITPFVLSPNVLKKLFQATLIKILLVFKQNSIVTVKPL